MARHLARRGGIWWTRLVVPERLRPALGRREFIQSCRTADIRMAKAVAAMLIAEWRQSMLRVELAGMDSQAIKLLKPAPALAIGSTITLAEAETLGVDSLQLLQIAAAGRLKLFCRLAGVPGHLLNPGNLQDDPLTGGKDIPPLRFMPAAATETVKNDVLALPDAPQIANSILVNGLDQPVEVVALAVASHQWFVPDRTLVFAVGEIEVEAKAVKAIRGYLAKSLPHEAIDRELAMLNPSSGHADRSADFGPRANELFSVAVDAYCKDPDGLPKRLASSHEIKQRRKSMLMFAEFMGDHPLHAITSDMLRRYRDGPLRTVPAKANNLPKQFKRDSMPATIQALKEAGEEYSPLSLEMRLERMAHLGRLFDWLEAKEWIVRNPAKAIHGETGVSRFERQQEKRERRSAKRLGDEEEGRQPFTVDELRLIFGQPQYMTGDGQHVTKKHKTWYPFEYWLPLIGLYAGCRIGEASQLHLSDIRQVSGVWVFDLNENTPDKKLKTDATSHRLIPIHPALIDLGLLSYCDQLREHGFKRLFPELSYSLTPARYGKEPTRKMSVMLARLGMPRNGDKVFHCFRHNANDALMRVPMSSLPFADENLRKFIRHKLMGHQQAEDVNTQHYTSSSIGEAASLVNAVSFDLPPIARFNADAGINSVKYALSRKLGDRRDVEDMGPAS